MGSVKVSETVRKRVYQDANAYTHGLVDRVYGESMTEADRTVLKQLIEGVIGYTVQSVDFELRPKNAKAEMYSLDHLPFPAWDSESAGAVLIKAPDGNLYTLCQYYQEEDGNTGQEVSRVALDCLTNDRYREAIWEFHQYGEDEDGEEFEVDYQADSDEKHREVLTALLDGRPIAGFNDGS